MQSFEEGEARGTKRLSRAAKLVFFAGYVVFLFALIVLAMHGQYLDVEQAAHDSSDSMPTAVAVRGH
jgi:hypothetical protein